LRENKTALNKKPARGCNSLKYVFGPVPSRRLGQSLGIDPVPLKTCSWNCVYCQLGRSTPVVAERREFHPRDDIMRELEAALDQHGPGDIDWVTFVGSGEPLLHTDIGWMIAEAKKLTDIPVAVITSGALLHRSEVRTALFPADAVLPTVDAGTPELYKKINRPHPDCPFEKHIEGLVAFRNEYDGKLWPEVMLMRGVNDSEEALRDIAAVLRRIDPDEVHISFPSRVPAETWIRPPDAEGFARAKAIIGHVARVVQPSDSPFELSHYDNIEDALIDIITRHPMREAELQETLARWTAGEVEQSLQNLEASGRVQLVERCGVRYWCAASSRYPEE
jgi:wyosine [tRNA(Phe)-imidazoG37] synthetase (radical SAM superfamily)